MKRKGPPLASHATRISVADLLHLPGQAWDSSAFSTNCNDQPQVAFNI